MYLWKISNDIIKKKIYNSIKEKLEKDFDYNIYMIAAIKGIVSNTEFLEEFVSEVIKYIKIDKELSWEGNKPSRENFVFDNLIIFISIVKVPENYKALSRIKNVPLHWQFFLHSRTFDYSKFDYKWLLLIHRKVVFDRLKDIRPLNSTIKKV